MKKTSHANLHTYNQTSVVAYWLDTWICIRCQKLPTSVYELPYLQSDAKLMLLLLKSVYFYTSGKVTNCKNFSPFETVR